MKSVSYDDRMKYLGMQDPVRKYFKDSDPTLPRFITGIWPFKKGCQKVFDPTLNIPEKISSFFGNAKFRIAWTYTPNILSMIQSWSHLKF